MLSLLWLIVASATLWMTPQVELATDFMQYYKLNWMIVSDLRHYSEETREFCETDPLEEKHILVEERTQRVDCEDVEEYFMNQYLEIGNLAYKIAWQCDELYNTNNAQLCLLRNNWELTKLSTDILKE